MELNEIIKLTLDELEKVKKHESKKNYLVDDLTFELYVSEISQTEGKIKIFVANLGANATQQNSHKITIKLKPKGNRNLNANRIKE